MMALNNELAVGLELVKILSALGGFLETFMLICDKN